MFPTLLFNFQYILNACATARLPLYTCDQVWEAVCDYYVYSVRVQDPLVNATALH